MRAPLGVEVRDLNLFEQYLVQLRQEKLQLGHSTARDAIDQREFVHIVARAHEAELIQKLLVALRALNSDPGTFIKEYLK